MPISWKGRISQYVGRLHRNYEGKDKVIVYDYVDDMKMLEKMCEKRKKAYKSLGYGEEG
jgi:superfamily II DNA or RNA helicase